MPDHPSPRPWYFAEGTERRVEVLVLEGPEYAIQCARCGVHFTLRHNDHGVSIGPDGALSAVGSFDCPKCRSWHRHVRGGVIQP